MFHRKTSERPINKGLSAITMMKYNVVLFISYLDVKTGGNNVINKEKKLHILKKAGFTKANEDEYELVMNGIGDRFETLIVYDIHNDSFYYGRNKSRGFTEVTKDEIMLNTNELHTSSKKHFIEVEKELAANGIMLP